MKPIQAYREGNNLLEWLRRFVNVFNALHDEFDALQNEFDTSQTIPAWNKVGATGQPAFQNGWLNYGLTTEDAAFRLNNSVELSIIGHIKSGPTGDSIVFQLPDSSYYPAKDSEFPAMVHKGSGVELAALEVHQDGTVWVHGISAAATHVSIHALVHLDN